MNVLNQEKGKNWVLYHGDSCEVLAGMPTDSVHYSIHQYHLLHFIHIQIATETWATAEIMKNLLSTISFSV